MIFSQSDDTLLYDSCFLIPTTPIITYLCDEHLNHHPKADDMTPSEDYGLRNPSPNNALFDTKADERARRRKAEEKAEMKAKGRANKGVNGGGKKNQVRRAAGHVICSFSHFLIFNTF